jgi:hypothetical protein
MKVILTPARQTDSGAYRSRASPIFSGPEESGNPSKEIATPQAANFFVSRGTCYIYLSLSDYSQFLLACSDDCRGRRSIPENVIVRDLARQRSPN